ncbi:MAG TPA: hypothetical protein VIW46_02120 [Acidimicrobiia bacterium]|jgi:hypothetical protein
MGAAVDCEAIGPGLLGQPVNAATSLVFVFVAVIVLLRRSDGWVAAGLAGTGVGSFLFHGPLAPGGEWIHDVTLAWLILVVGLRVRGMTDVGAPIGLAVIGPVFVVAPQFADPLTVTLLILVVFVLLADRRDRATLLPLGLLGLSAVIGRLGATGAPLCDPESWLQTHGLWHIGAAVAVGWWASARRVA